MKDDVVGQQVIVIPAGATPGQPQWDVLTGAFIPAELQTHYSNQVTVAQIRGELDGPYAYDVVLASGANAVGTVDSSLTVAELWRYSQSSGAAQATVGRQDPAALIVGFSGVVGSSLQVVNDSSLIIDDSVSYTIDGQEQGRGFFAQDSSSAGTGNLAAETIIATIAATFRSNRAYRFEVSADLFGTALDMQYQIRRTNLAGAVVWTSAALPVQSPTGSSVRGDIFGYLKTGSTSDVTRTLVLTAQPVGGGNVQVNPLATQRRTWTIVDVGTDSQWSGPSV